MADVIRYSSADAITAPSAETYAALRNRFQVLARVIDAVSAERQMIWTEIRKREKSESELLRLGNVSAERKAVLREVVRNL